MKNKLSILALGLVLLLLAVQVGVAQEGVRPLVIVQGTPDTVTSPPEVSTYISVIDPSTGVSIEGLAPGDFQIEEGGADVEAKLASYETVGLAVVVVVDRGGISARGDRNSVLNRDAARISDAIALAEDLMNKLGVAGASSDDLIAVVGIGAGGSLDPYADFSYNPVDLNKAKNTLGPMKEQSVEGGTPLYEGLDEALRLLTEHPDAIVSEVLSRRRKIVVVFSDGIDPGFSDSAREDDIIRKANDADISLYTVGMAHRDEKSLSGAGNLERLAIQTKGLYVLHNDDVSHRQVSDMFGRLMTQRQQYKVTYETRRPKGEYSLQFTVRTAIAETRVAAVLEPPRLSLTSPRDGDAITVPITYDETTCLYVSTKRGDFRYETTTTISLSVALTSVDGAPREPAEVRYFASGDLIGTSASAPTYDFAWDVTNVVTPTEQTQEREFTLTARADDPYLGERIESQEVTIVVTWEPEVQTGCAAWEGAVYGFWWVACIVAVLVLAIVALFIMLLRTRGRMGQMARKVATSTTGVLKGITKRLGALPQQSPGKLVVVHGSNVGREFRLSTPVVKVGRDPQFCDIALHDDFVSNPHFTIQLEHTHFYITDENSTNGTKLNGVPIPPRQRMLLQPDAMIEIGNTRLQFKRLGGTTRQLRGEVPAAPPAHRPPPAHPPTQPQQLPHPKPAVRPPVPPQQPPPQPAPVRGGPTVQLPEEPPVEPRRGGPTVQLPEEEPLAEPKRGGPTVQLPEEQPLAEPKRGGPTVQLPEEEPQAEPKRGGPTVQLPEEPQVEPKRGGPTVRLLEEEPLAEVGRGGPTVRLPREESQAEAGRGGPTVRLPREDREPGPQPDGTTVMLPVEE